MSNNDKDNLYKIRHSLAHIMASAVMKLWPDAKLGIGPVVDDGFYYDIDIDGVNISEVDFDKIEKQMRVFIDEYQQFTKSSKSIDDALSWASDAKQPFKTELLNDLKRSGTTAAKDLTSEGLGTIAEGEGSVDEVSFYTNGDFTDLCRGPHVESTKKVGAFKLQRVAGAYWRGDQTKPQMQRLYGVAFETQVELDDYLKMQEIAKERDHRKLGKELDLFTFSEKVGSGLPLFTPRGTVLRDLLGQYSQQVRKSRGFDNVYIPHITKKDLYVTSGHWDKFGDELFLVTSQETSDELVMKPMNCPHHTQIYASKPRSYRDLPVKFMENTTVYRDEKSGELHGLSRVRSITQDDSHVFCTDEQIEDSVGELIDAAKEVYKTLDLDLKFNLSFRDDSDGYLGDKKLWDSAQATLESIAKQKGLDYVIDEGEAAFYGPKIDFIGVDGLGRQWQVATVQLDFVQPSRFELIYAAADGTLKTPVMIHAALLGSIERFLSIYIEHTGGAFPFWLAPEQLRIVTITDKVADFVDEVKSILEGVVLNKPLKFNELRFTVDDRNDSLGKRLHEAESMKIPVTLIIGPKDAQQRQVSVKTAEKEEKVDLDSLADWLKSRS